MLDPEITPGIPPVPVIASAGSAPVVLPTALAGADQAVELSTPPPTQARRSAGRSWSRMVRDLLRHDPAQRREMDALYDEENPAGW